MLIVEKGKDDMEILYLQVSNDFFFPMEKIHSSSKVNQ